MCQLCACNATLERKCSDVQCDMRVMPKYKRLCRYSAHNSVDGDVQVPCADDFLESFLDADGHGQLAVFCVFESNI